MLYIPNAARIAKSPYAIYRVATMRRASNIGRDHEGEHVATGVSTDDFNTAERQATLGITSYDTGFHCGVLGCSISGQRCSAGNYLLYADAWLQSGHAEPARFRPGFNWRPQVNLERSRASGSRPMPDGRQQEPGGWNRVLLQVQDLPARIADLKEAGLGFRNEMEVGPGGKQIQIEDHDGNPIELFEPARH